MSSINGGPSKPLELGEKLFIQVPDGDKLEYEVVGVLDDEEGGESYAVLMNEGEAKPDAAGTSDDEDDRSFVVTDLQGNIIESDDLAQEILDDFILFQEEAAEEGSET
ncbi:MAG: hypothetical protein ACLQPV_02825 [Vulcanimicrobiaceae bacterium]